MSSLVFIVPGTLGTRTGGYIYDRHMVEGLRMRGWSVKVEEIELVQAERVFADIPSGTLVLVDGLAFSALPEVAEREASRLRLVALVHQPRGMEIGIDAGARTRVEANERRALGAARLVVVTGKTSVAVLARYGLSSNRIVVIEPGTERTPARRSMLSHGSKGHPVQLLCVATLNPGKGHEILLRALASLLEPEWCLTCVGSLTRDRQTTARVQSLVHELRLEDRVTLTGELDEAGVADWYDRADLFVLATLQETYGMAVAEALAHGLPVISTATGAIPDLVGSDAGIVVSLGSVDALAEALAEALSRTLNDAGLRERFAAGARRVREHLPTWDEAVDTMHAALVHTVAHV